MIEKILNKKIYILYILPFLLGTLTVFSFQPFNFTFINFLIIPLFFLITIYVQKRSKNFYREKPYLSNLFLVGYLFGVGYFLAGIHWISYSLTFDDQFKYLIPISLYKFIKLTGSISDKSSSHCKIVKLVSEPLLEQQL